MKTNNFEKKSLIGLSLLTAVLCAGCTQPEHAKNVLEKQGYNNIQMQGYDFFNCAKGDWYHDKFIATGPTGQNVSGVVCAGLFFKGSTTRLD